MHLWAMNRHSNLAFFIPHRGCPNACSFCDQRIISGKAAPPAPEEIVRTCRSYLETYGSGRNAEIAFFGGSFTAIPRQEMISYLRAVQPFLTQKDGFSGVRISTRPDALGEDVLHILQEYGVTAVEIGAQSLSDHVLHCNRRGHTAAEVYAAAARVQEYGFSLGLQMMYGLYGSTSADEERTLAACIRMQPDTMRLYPTVILEGTYLAELYRSGVYVQPSWEEMLSFLGDAICRLKAAGIRLIRCGLHAQQELEQRMIAGFYHPAMKELAVSQLYLRTIDAAIAAAMPCDGVQMVTAKGCIGFAAGHNSSTRRYLREKYSRLRVKFAEDEWLREGQVRFVFCRMDESGNMNPIGEEVYDVFKIT